MKRDGFIVPSRRTSCCMSPKGLDLRGCQDSVTSDFNGPESCRHPYGETSLYYPTYAFFKKNVIPLTPMKALKMQPKLQFRQEKKTFPIINPSLEITSLEQNAIRKTTRSWPLKSKLCLWVWKPHPPI